MKGTASPMSALTPNPPRDDEHIERRDIVEGMSRKVVLHTHKVAAGGVRCNGARIDGLRCWSDDAKAHILEAREASEVIQCFNGPSHVKNFELGKRRRPKDFGN